MNPPNERLAILETKFNVLFYVSMAHIGIESLEKIGLSQSIIPFLITMFG